APERIARRAAAVPTDRAVRDRNAAAAACVEDSTDSGVERRRRAGTVSAHRAARERDTAALLVEDAADAILELADGCVIRGDRGVGERELAGVAYAGDEPASTGDRQAVDGDREA